MTDTTNAACGALFGAFVGDAAGATLEMMARTPTDAKVQRAVISRIRAACPCCNGRQFKVLQR